MTKVALEAPVLRIRSGGADETPRSFGRYPFAPDRHPTRRAAGWSGSYAPSTNHSVKFIYRLG